MCLQLMGECGVTTTAVMMWVDGRMMDRWVGGWMDDGQVDGLMDDGQMSGWTDGWVDEWMCGQVSRGREE